MQSFKLASDLQKVAGKSVLQCMPLFQVVGHTADTLVERRQYADGKNEGFSRQGIKF